MADAHQYHEWLWHVLYLGKPTAEQEAAMAKTRVKRARESIGKGAAPASALDQLKALREAAIAGQPRPED
jgi:hypothetical protein